MVRLGKWLSVHLGTKWFLDWVQLQRPLDSYTIDLNEHR